MFAKESDMSASAANWLSSMGLTVKAEFTSPWGICDFVGLSFNPEKVAHRLDLKQTKAIGSVTRTHLLREIPDVEKGRAISFNVLMKPYASVFSREQIEIEVERLVADKFVVRNKRGNLQKRNGWVPLHDRLIAVELKLSRISEVMNQAKSNLGFADESYVGLPADVAQRIYQAPARWSEFFDAGVGLLSVKSDGCEILIHSSKAKDDWLDTSLQMYCVEKFWRTRSKGN